LLDLRAGFRVAVRGIDQEAAARRQLPAANVIARMLVGQVAARSVKADLAEADALVAVARLAKDQGLGILRPEDVVAVAIVGDQRARLPGAVGRRAPELRRRSQIDRDPGNMTTIGRDTRTISLADVEEKVERRLKKIQLGH